MKTNKTLEKVWQIIDSLMKKESTEEITLERQYLPELFDEEVLELSKDDGLPIIKPHVLLYIGLKGIITKLYGNVLKFEKTEIDPKVVSDINMYLEDILYNEYKKALEILEQFDSEKPTVQFESKRAYADFMLREANIHFNRQEYEVAAKYYETAGEWAALESLDKEVISEASKLAINSWITSCQVGEAFRILEKLAHGEALEILKGVTSKIGEMADYLADIYEFESAREQLHKAILKYQTEALSEEVKYLTNKLNEINQKAKRKNMVI